MTLSRAELIELTGYRRASLQAQWLKNHGWIFTVAASGRPVVLRSYAERRLGGHVAVGEPEPNFAAIR